MTIYRQPGQRVSARPQSITTGGGSSTIYASSSQTSLPLSGGFVERGGIAWRAGTDYSIGDVVTFSNTQYIAIAADTNSQTAPNVNSNWQLVAVPSNQINHLWDASSSYDDGNIVHDGNDNTYVAIQNSTGVNPATDPRRVPLEGV